MLAAALPAEHFGAVERVVCVEGLAAGLAAFFGAAAAALALAVVVVVGAAVVVVVGAGAVVVTVGSVGRSSVLASTLAVVDVVGSASVVRPAVCDDPGLRLLRRY